MAAAALIGDLKGPRIIVSNLKSRSTREAIEQLSVEQLRSRVGELERLLEAERTRRAFVQMQRDLIRRTRKGR